MRSVVLPPHLLSLPPSISFFVVRKGFFVSIQFWLTVPQAQNSSWWKAWEPGSRGYISFLQRKQRSGGGEELAFLKIIS